MRGARHSSPRGQPRNPRCARRTRSTHQRRAVNIPSAGPGAGPTDSSLVHRFQPENKSPPDPLRLGKLKLHRLTQRFPARVDNIVALKDAKGNIAATSWVIKRCGIPVYSGDDILNLPFLSVGAVGFVSVCGHTVGRELKEMLNAWFAGDSARALEIHQQLLPVFTGTFRTQGAILTKAAMNLMGLPGGTTRLPLVDATAEQIEQLRKDLSAGGVTLKK